MSNALKRMKKRMERQLEETQEEEALKKEEILVHRRDEI